MRRSFGPIALSKAKLPNPEERKKYDLVKVA